MYEREDQITEQILTSYFEAAQREYNAPAGLWERVSAGIERDAPRASWDWRLHQASGRRVAALAVAVALVAVVAVSPWSDENGTNPATDLLQRARAAALDSPALESVYVRIRDEQSLFENTTEPVGMPDGSDVMTRETRWADPLHWRSETEIEYVRNGSPVDPQPTWLKGGVTVSDGEHVWTYSDVEPGAGADSADLNHPQVHVRSLQENDGLGLGQVFALGGLLPADQSTGDISRTLELLEECFDARLDGTEIVAGRDAHVVRMQPHNMGEQVTDVIDAGSCMSIVAQESTPSGGRVAEQEMTLWIDAEYFFILKAEQIARLTSGDGDPMVSVSRTEVVDLELNPPIPDDHFDFTPPPDVPVVDER